MKETLSFQVDQKAEDWRVDEYLASQFSGLSRMRIARLIADEACTVNGLVAHAGCRVKVGDGVSLNIDADEVSGGMTPEALPLAIIHEDDDLLVVVKAQGMLVHPTRGVKSGTLLNALVYHLNRDLIQRANFEVALRPGLVHRLDKATSGLMVIAKNQRALSILSRHFHLRLVEKKYTALVRGCVATDEMLINEPIGRQEEGWPKWRVLKTGKAAETHLRVIERRELSTLLELEPRTGRTNQLRIHCSAVGHPIVGDDIYGDGEASSPRLCLHAAHLAFHHPANGEWLEFNSEPPEEVFSPSVEN